MRIVHIYKDYFPVVGGIENHVKQLAEAQANRGHDVAVLVTNLDATRAVETINGVRVIRSPRHVNLQSAPVGFGFTADVRRVTDGADVAHLHAPYPVGEAANLLYGRARATIITWHSDIVRQKALLRAYTPILRRVIARADRIICTSDAYRRTSPWLREWPAKCRVVPLSVDTRRFTPHTQRGPGRGPGSALRLLSVGRLRYYKSLDRIIRVMPQLADCELAIAGNGPMEAEWRALAQRIGVDERVRFVGSPSEEDLPDVYRRADAYVLPATSRAEAFGVALLEAMASGLPVVCTEVGTATSWVNQDGVTGIVVPPDDDAAMIAAIGRLRDPTVRVAMGRAARMRVEAEFTPLKMIERIEAVYREVIPRGAGASARRDEDETSSP
jgi:rhamnosyl/mannosyltransferase